MADQKHPLVGDWRGRLVAALSYMGLDSLEEFLAHFPGVPYCELTEKLGRQNATPIALSTLQFERAKKLGRLRDAAMDALARAINHNLRHGWEQPKKNRLCLDAEARNRIDFVTASAYADWASSVQMADRSLKDRGEQVWQALKRQCPPEGWRPSGPLDPFIVRAFFEGWPERA